MRDHVSVVRSETSLDAAVGALSTLLVDPALDTGSLDAITTRTMTLLAREIAISALNRRESRGGHFRSDVPSTDPELNARHQLVTRQPNGIFERTFGALDLAWTATIANR